MDLSGLPHDVRGLILQQPSLLPLSPYVPGRLGQEASKLYYQKYCQAAISKEEFLAYFETKPVALALFDVNTRSDNYYEMDALSFFRQNESTYTQIVSDTGIYYEGLNDEELYLRPVYDTESVAYNEIRPFFDPHYDLVDLQGQYQIYKRRLSCQRLDSGFAGQMVRQQFEQIVNNSFKTWSPYPILNQFKLYLWLFINFRIIAGNRMLYIEAFIHLPPSIGEDDVIFMFEPLTVDARRKIEMVTTANQEMMEHLRELISNW